MTVLLPDISEFQPNADMAGIKAKNGGAVIIRVAYGTRTDKVFAAKCAAARKAGFPFLGLYQYLTAFEDPAAQARAYCQLVGGALTPAQVPVCDLEEGTGSQAARFMTWAGIVEHELGKRPWLYSGAYFAVDHGLAAVFNGPHYHTWVAAYGNTEPALGHTLWQSTNGQVGANITDWPGCGRCDTSIYHGTFTQLAALTGSPQPPPPPVPPPPAPGGIVTEHVTAGEMSLAELAAQHATTPARILRTTDAHLTPGGPQWHAVADFVNEVWHGTVPVTDPMPAGLHLWMP